MEDITFLYFLSFGYNKPILKTGLKTHISEEITTPFHGPSPKPNQKSPFARYSSSVQTPDCILIVCSAWLSDQRG